MTDRAPQLTDMGFFAILRGGPSGTCGFLARIRTPPQEDIVVKRVESNRAGVLLLVFALAVALQGCDIFSPPKDKPKPDPVPPMPALSPQDVIDNIEYAYNHFEYEERYQPLIRSDFVFLFDPNDVGVYPGVPQDGWWGQPEELESAEHMLDQNYEPSDPTFKINNMELLIQLSGKLEDSNLQGAPEGTVEGYVTFDLRVEAGDGAKTLLVHSRPLFFFSPDDPNAEQKTWRLWQIKDAPYDND
jgi:hypothetical protein